MGVSRLLELYWQALVPSGNRLEKTLPRLYQTGEGSSKHSDSVIGSGSGINARVAFLAGHFLRQQRTSRAIGTALAGRHFASRSPFRSTRSRNRPGNSMHKPSTSCVLLMYDAAVILRVTHEAPHKWPTPRGAFWLP